jgi:hypothetical protein
MKNLRLMLALGLAGFVFTALRAADEKKETPEAHPAGCCAKKEAKGEHCTHDCCVEAAKAGNNCEHCKGSGKIADNHPAEKK